MLQVPQDIMNLPEIGIKMKELEKEKEDEKKKMLKIISVPLHMRMQVLCEGS